MWESIAATIGANLVGSMMNDGADKASGIQTAAANEARGVSEQAVARALANNQRQFDLTREDYAPYMAAGQSSVQRLRDLLGLGDGSSYAPVVDKEKFYGGGNEQYWRDFFTNDYKAKTGGLEPNPEVQAKIDSLVATKMGERPFDQASYDAALAAAKTAGENARAADPLGNILNRRFTMDDFTNDPVTKASFDSGLSEGEKAVQRMFGARGMSKSGAAVKAMTRFAGDYTNQKIGESQARFTQDQNNLYSRLTGVTGIGQNATNSAANVGASLAGSNAAIITAGGNTAADLITGAGNARGAAAIASGNRTQNMFSNIGSTISGQYNLDKILGRSGINTTGTLSRPAFSLNSYSVPDALEIG